jgi:hypothetical protein
MDNACFEMKEAFLFGGLSPPNKKIIPLRTPCLGGEISILDESVVRDTEDTEENFFMENRPKVP